MIRVFIHGLLTGFVLQLAIGPVFFFIVNIVLQRTRGDGFLSVLAVAVVDYCYILLAIAGAGKLLEYQKIRKTLGVLSAFVLFVFGIGILLSTRTIAADIPVHARNVSNYWSSFLSAFLLTMSSPLTIVFWTSLFALKAIEYGYTKRNIVIFGVSAGLSTLLFLGGAVLTVSLFKASIPVLFVKILNGVVGVVLMIYSTLRFVNAFRNDNTVSPDGWKKS